MFTCKWESIIALSEVHDGEISFADVSRAVLLSFRIWRNGKSGLLGNSDHRGENPWYRQQKSLLNAKLNLKMLILLITVHNNNNNPVNKKHWAIIGPNFPNRSGETVYWGSDHRVTTPDH